jgi:hypothetical protein
MSQLTELAGRVQAGDAGVRDALFAAAYSELHGLAHTRLRDGGLISWPHSAESMS